MGAITTGVVTFALIYSNVGFGSLFLKVWMRSWGLAYLIVVPTILAVGSKLRALVARIFISAKGRMASDMDALPPRITFALAMGVITTGLISFSVILMNLGLRQDFTHLWIKSWGLGYVVVIPVLLIVGPRVQRLVDKVLFSD